MAERTTDGASTATVDPAASSGWDSVLSEGIASTGVDPNASFESADDPDATTPQSGTDGSSAGAGTPGSPATPQSAPTGDDGQAPTVESTADDPLASAEPFTYTVNGEAKTIDGAYRLPGEGLYVPEDRVPQFQLLASRADSLERTNQELYQRHQALEKATTWQQGDTILTGGAALEARNVFIEQSKETIRQLAAVLTPEHFAKYVDIGQNADGTYFVQPNQGAINDLRDRLQFGNERAGFTARQSFAKIAPPAAPQPEADTTPVESIAEPTVTGIAQQLGVTLSPDAKTFLAAQLPRYVRASTEQERMQTGRPRIVDAAFGELVKREAATAATTAKVAETASTAGKFNAGMNAGRKPAVVPPKPATAPTAPAAPAKVGKAAQWDNVLQSALSDMAL